MDLVACSAPGGELEPAPATALCAQNPDVRWDGFWAGDDEYYVRRTEEDGRIGWYRLHETSVEPEVARAEPVTASPDREAARVATRRSVLLLGTGRLARRYLLAVRGRSPR